MRFDRLGNQEILAQIAKDYRLTPAHVVVAGDNAESEIRGGIALA